MNIEKYKNKVIQGDCLKIMKDMPENSVDTIITDPPAGISFMGKKWDSNKGGRDKWIEWLTEVMKECYRVAKPGSTALVWAIPRTSHWTATAIENAGWQIKDIIMHIFGSGFPKSHNIGKSVEKIIGTKKGIKVETGTQGYSYNKEYVAGKCMGGKQISGDIPVYEINNNWGGYGTALKPAAEHWILAMRPNDKTYANNALKWGVSGLNIDGGRIGRNKEDISGWSQAPGRASGFSPGDESKMDYTKPREQKRDNPGRFPANIILNEKAARLLDEQSGERKVGARRKGQVRHTKEGDIVFATGITQTEYPASSGGASRFFYVAKASREERNMGCEGLDKGKPVRWNKAGKWTNDTTPATNNHPTVKPLKLMEYLCTLTKTPTGGIVLDPFLGSGTTAMACKKTGRDFVGIEKEPEYVKIARARINATQRAMI